MARCCGQGLVSLYGEVIVVCSWGTGGTVVMVVVRARVFYRCDWFDSGSVQLSH